MPLTSIIEVLPQYCAWNADTEHSLMMQLSILANDFPSIVNAKPHSWTCMFEDTSSSSIINQQPSIISGQTTILYLHDRGQIVISHHARAFANDTLLPADQNNLPYLQPHKSTSLDLCSHDVHARIFITCHASVDDCKQLPINQGRTAAVLHLTLSRIPASSRSISNRTKSRTCIDTRQTPRKKRRIDQALASIHNLVNGLLSRLVNSWSYSNRATHAGISARTRKQARRHLRMKHMHTSCLSKRLDIKAEFPKKLNITHCIHKQ